MKWRFLSCDKKVTAILNWNGLQFTAQPSEMTGKKTSCPLPFCVICLATPLGLENAFRALTILSGSMYTTKRITDKSGSV